MTHDEAMQAARHAKSIRVRTRSGAVYEVARDVIETSPDGYVYGERADLPRHRGPFDRRYRGTRWFDLRNVKLA